MKTNPFMDNLARDIEKATGYKLYGMKEQLLLQSATGVTNNSQAVKPGMIFMALKGTRVNGEDFIPAAIKQGASIVIASSEACGALYEYYKDVQFIALADVASWQARLAAYFYPKKPKVLVAVTGTNGKTSVVNFCNQLWQALGYKAAGIGTLGLTGESTLPTVNFGLTSPDVITLHQTLHQLVLDGVEAVAIEASSHGLVQGRFKGIAFNAAAFTNLSHDHLDYHKTFKAYLAAKALLFTEHLADNGTAVLNADIPEYSTLVKYGQKKHFLSYGKTGSTFTLSYIKVLEKGVQVGILYCQKNYTFHFPLVGRFQLMNFLAALALVLSTLPEKKREQIFVKLLKSAAFLKPVPGRLEEIATFKGARIYIDYAHTPHSLKVALTALRKATPGKLTVLFGCGGNRDTEKRALMGNIAETCADQVIITDDNPRFEDPAQIRNAIAQHCAKGQIVANRERAIYFALERLQQGDTLLIAGKGHETEQHIKGEVVPFSDGAVVKNYLGALDAVDT